MAQETTTPRYEDLSAPERAALDAWNRVSADTTGMLYAVRAALTAAQPIGPDARDRLARHLGMQSVASPDECLRQADALLAVITGQESNR